MKRELRLHRLQRHVRSARSKGSAAKRKSLFEAQDQVDPQREEIIASIEGKFTQKTSLGPLFLRFAGRCAHRPCCCLGASVEIGGKALQPVLNPTLTSAVMTYASQQLAEAMRLPGHAPHLLYELGGQTVAHFRGYLSEADTRKVLRCYQRGIGRSFDKRILERVIQ